MKRSKFLLSVITVFCFLCIKNVSAQSLSAGTYKIINANDNNKLLVEKNSNIELGDSNSTGESNWDVTYDGSSYYIKSHSNNNIALDIYGGNIKNGTNIHTYKVNNSNAQKWKLVDAGNGYYYIRSILGEYNIDVYGGYTAVGSNIQLYKANGSNAQKWKFIKQSSDPRPLEDGTYIIKSKLKDSNVIDLHGGSTKNFTNVQIYSNNYTWAQVWNIKYDNGYYVISSYLNNNKALDVYGGTFKNSANINLYDKNGTNAQKFSIVKNSDNTYTINSYNNTYCLDISGGSTSLGANIQLYKSNGTNAQKFNFEKVNIDPPESGYYTINSLLDNNKVISVNNAAISNFKNVDLRTSANRNYNKWYLQKLENDTYAIKNAENNKYALDVYGGSTSSGANVNVYKYNASKAQKWVIRKYDDGNYKIIGLGSGKVLDVKGASTSDGANIQIYSSNNSDAQKFKLNKTEISQYVRAYDPGKYTIKSNLNTSKVLDIYGGYKDNGANVQVYANNSTPAQIWKLEYLGDGVYIVRSMMNPDLVLAASGNNAVSTKYTDSNTQKWYFDKNGNTTTIINLSSGKYLKVDSNNPANLTNVSLSDSVTEQNKFVLSSNTGTIKYKGIDISQYNTITSWSNLSKQIDFAVLRVGYGGDATSQDDTKFSSYVDACEQNNIPYAVYLYSYADNNSGSIDEANHMLRRLRNNHVRSLLSTKVYYDQEDTSYLDQSKITNATRTSMVNTFCNKLKSNGYNCGLYASKSWLEGMLDIVNIHNNHHGVWVAHWPGYNTFSQGLSGSTSYQKTPYIIWQFSSKGNLPGMSGNVDMDIGYNIFD